MAFSVVKKNEMRVVEFGRKASGPRIVIQDNGRIAFNSWISKEWAGCNRLIILFDGESNKMLAKALKPDEKIPIKGVTEENCFRLSWSKVDKVKNPKDVEVASIGAAVILTDVVKYDYKAAGHQPFEAQLDDKLKGYVFTIPKTTPTKRPVHPRKKKAATVGGVVAPSPAPVNVAAPAEEELILD